MDIKRQIFQLERCSLMDFISCEHRTKRKLIRSVHGLLQCQFGLGDVSLFTLKFQFLRNYSVSSSGRLLRIGDPHGSVKPYLMKVSELEDRLVQNGKYDAATPHNRSNLPHLITWFQTNEAMVMFLSNHTVQVSVSATFSWLTESTSNFYRFFSFSYRNFRSI